MAGDQCHRKTAVTSLRGVWEENDMICGFLRIMLPTSDYFLKSKQKILVSTFVKIVIFVC